MSVFGHSTYTFRSAAETKHNRVGLLRLEEAPESAESVMSYLERTERITTLRVFIGVALIGFASHQALSQEANGSADEDPLVIGAIDFYGLRSISAAEVRELLPFREGDERSPGFLSDDLKVELTEALQVSRVAMNGVCCMDDGRAIIFIGIEETASAPVAYHSAPTGDIELPDEILQTATEYDEASWEAVRNGDAAEDISEGHSVARNPRLRALGERFVGYADTHWETLVEVLHTSNRPGDRAVAAQVIAYAADKSTVASQLEQAVLDPDVTVRNNAIRALSIIATYAKEHPELDIEIRPDDFVDMLNSIEWLDRNKASWILSTLTESRDSQLIAELRSRALASLIEMCSWKSFGHAFPSCIMLERILGLPEQDALRPRDGTIAMASKLLEQTTR